MSIESLKEQARRHEQKEEWQKALDQYNKALAELAREEQVDIGLYNRVGDLCVRIGDLDSAVERYDKAVDLYREAYLPNNAIAVCKKIIRNVPDRHQVYLRIGQIRAEQGFLPDARTNFLTYAERMQQSGLLDESFRALIEFCDLAPDDVGVRVTVAEQMAASGRDAEAVEQLLIARQHFTQNGDLEQAQGVEAKILEIDPEAELAAVPVVDPFGASSVGLDGEIVADFGEIGVGPDSGGFSDLQEAAEEVASSAEGGPAQVAEAEVEVGGDFELSGASEDDDDQGEQADDEEEEAVELPTMDFGSTDDDEEAVEAPTIDLDGEDDDDAPVVELPTMDFEEDSEEAEPLPMMSFDEDEDDEEVVELPIMDFGNDDEASTQPVDDGSLALEDEPETAEMPETAFALDDTPSEASDALADAVEEEAAAPAMEVQVEAPASPVAPPPPPVEPEPAAEAPASDGEDYVDFGAMILGSGEEKKSTRFTVAYEEPSGDEAADFAKMLSQFKEKVSENLDSSDVRAHYDLGTAYKEMGLLDEAISSFQAALRASSDHLPTYELMGQTFIEMGQPEAAVNSLRRALEADVGVEDDLVGIYYYLAKAYEELDNKPAAVEYYDKVFSLDINFADVTERLRELR